MRTRPRYFVSPSFPAIESRVVGRPVRLAIFRWIDAIALFEPPRERALEGAAAAVGDLLDRQVGASQQLLRPHVHV